MEHLNLALRWLHILSAITLVGGVLYTRFAVLPMLSSLDEGQRDTVGAAMRRNWAKFLMISAALLLATGITNMVLIPKTIDPELKSNYSMWLGIKFLLAMIVFFIVSALNGRSNMAVKFREKSGLWLNIAVFLSVAIVLLAGYLRFVPRAPKSDESNEPAAARFDSPAQPIGRANFSGATSKQKA